LAELDVFYARPYINAQYVSYICDLKLYTDRDSDHYKIAIYR